jgi:hypothetical protein
MVAVISIELLEASFGEPCKFTSPTSDCELSIWAVLECNANPDTPAANVHNSRKFNPRIGFIRDLEYQRYRFAQYELLF